MPDSNPRQAVPAEGRAAHQRVPEVSIITSWRIRIRSDQEQASEEQSGLDRRRLPGLEEALAEGIPILDLYLLDHHEVRIYADAALRGDDYRAWLKARDRKGVDEPSPRGYSYSTPADFLSSLKKHEIRMIADFLREQMVIHYIGHGIGRRPRITSLATYFPLISLPVAGEAEPGSASARTVLALRRRSVQALRASLYLAKCLGCHCVEAVGGSRIPQPQNPRNVAEPLSPSAYLKARQEALVESLKAVFDVNEYKRQFLDPTDSGEAERLDGDDYVNENWLESEPEGDANSAPRRPPYLALEVEPGSSYLLRDVKSYYAVWKDLGEWLRDRVGLNADLAHLFLTGVTSPEDLTRDYRTGNDWSEDRKVEGDRRVLDTLRNSIIHMHLSDHAGDARSGGIHASDLVPGQYHLLSHYREWLEFACSPPARFSGTVAIELESSFRAEDLVTARNVVRRWLQQIVPRDSAVLTGNVGQNLRDFHDAAILVIDLGNSTHEFYSDWDQHKKEDSLALHYVLDRTCVVVRKFGGSVMSYTGDGVIALFEKQLLPGAAAHIAQHVACIMAREIKDALDNCRVWFPRFDRSVPLTLRCALHSGQCFIPTTGTLNDKAISPDVVCAARLCAWLGNTIEPAEPRMRRYYDSVSSSDASAPQDASVRRGNQTKAESDGDWSLKETRPAIPGMHDNLESARQIPERKILMGCTESFYSLLEEEIRQDEIPAKYEPFEGVRWIEWGWVPMKGLGAVQIRLDRP